jgi:thiamine pyrophosphokinase
VVEADVVKILIVGAAPGNRPTSLLSDLASCCDAVIAADGGGTACLAAGIVPELLVGDLDSLSGESERRLKAAGTRFVTASPAKDVTDLDLALEQARELRADEILATGVLGGRLDHALAALGSLSRYAEARPSIREGDLDAWILSPGARHLLRFEEVGALVSILPLYGEARVTCTGFRYPLSDDVLLPLGSRGVSNVVSSAPATVQTLAGVLLVMCPREEPYPTD